MRTALLASRHLTMEHHYGQIKEALTRLGTTELHHGGEGAARQHADTWARETGQPVIGHAPDWAQHGRAAGPIRGRELIAAVETVVALWDGKSKGTTNELKEARRQGKRVTLLLV